MSFGTYAIGSLLFSAILFNTVTYYLTIGDRELHQHTHTHKHTLRMQAKSEFNTHTNFRQMLGRRWNVQQGF